MILKQIFNYAIMYTYVYSYNNPKFKIYNSYLN